MTSFGLVSQTTKEKEENLLSRKQWSVDSSILCKCYMSPWNSLLPWTAYDAPQINRNLNHKHKALKIGSQDCMWLLILHNFHSIEQNWRLYNDARRKCCRRFLSHEKQKDLLHPAYSWVPCSQEKDDSTGKIERSII